MLKNLISSLVVSFIITLIFVLSAKVNFSDEMYRNIFVLFIVVLISTLILSLPLMYLIKYFIESNSKIIKCKNDIHRVMEKHPEKELKEKYIIFYNQQLFERLLYVMGDHFEKFNISTIIIKQYIFEDKLDKLLDKAHVSNIRKALIYSKIYYKGILEEWELIYARFKSNYYVKIYEWDIKILVSSFISLLTFVFSLYVADSILEYSLFNLLIIVFLFFTLGIASEFAEYKSKLNTTYNELKDVYSFLTKEKN